MSRGGLSTDVWYDCHAPGHQMDDRHTAIHPKLRSAESKNKGSFGWTSDDDPRARRAPTAVAKGSASAAAAAAATAAEDSASSAGVAAAKEASASSERVVVELIKFAGAWSSRPIGSSDDADVYYVRQSSMRSKSDWRALRVGCRVSFVMKRAAGRAIVSDAVIE